MKVNEFLIENQKDNLPRGIQAHLKKAGYQQLGAGQDMVAYLEPGTSLVLKIFGSNTASDATSPKLTFPQRTFKSFADYCLKNKSNPFLPQFFGWETFAWEDYLYLQIRMERLFQSNGTEDILYICELLANLVEEQRDVMAFIDAIIEGYDDAYGEETEIAVHKLITLLGPTGLTQFIKTLTELSNIARANNYTFDLHAGNFMFGSDGHIVISDPFFSGWDNRHD